MVWKALKHTVKGRNHVPCDKIFDSRISQIEELFAKFLPKFLDLYVSIYSKFSLVLKVAS